MASKLPLDELGMLIAQAAAVESVWLFGSYARDEPIDRPAIIQTVERCYRHTDSLLKVNHS